MKNTVKCRKCNGTGEYLNGVCFDCYGSGELAEMRYQTTKPSESSHPAMRADREEKPLPYVRPPESFVKAELAKMWSMLAVDDPEAESVSERAVYEVQLECDHEFVNYHASICKHCNVFEEQFRDAIQIWREYAAPLQAGAD